MKKTLLLGVALAALLASCSSDEVVDAPKPTQRGIGFSTFVDKSSRAFASNETNNQYGYTSANIDQFLVSGYMQKDGGTLGRPFDRQLVYKEGSWKYDPTKYWEGGYNYTFIAAAPVRLITTSGGSGNQITLVEPPKSVSETDCGKVLFTNYNGQHDFIAAFDATYAVTKVPETGAVNDINFNFKHMLSRVTFAFTNMMEDEMDIEVTNVNITAPAEGIVTLNKDVEKSTWDTYAESTRSDITIDFLAAEIDVPANQGKVEAKSVIGHSTTKETVGRYIIPFKDKVYTVKFKILRHMGGDLKVESNKSVTLPVPAGGWLPGHSYRFIAEINSSNVADSDLRPIVFTASVTDWVQDENTGYNIKPTV